MALQLVSKLKPAGDQPKAINEIIKGLKNQKKHQVLLGATGTGKTFTIANVLAKTNKSAIVLSHNKTLAGQLYSELKTLFPYSKVEYFISNFDYYRPEAYLPSSDTFIDKTSKSNFDIEAMRVNTINSLVVKQPVIVIASVAAIYGQITPIEYKKMFLKIEVGQKIDRSDFFYQLVIRNYQRNAIDLKPGTFRSRGDIIEICPFTLSGIYFRIELFGSEIESIKQLDYLNNEVQKVFTSYTIFPANAYTTSKATIENAVKTIKIELKDRLKYFQSQNKLLEAQRLKERVESDINSLLEFGIVSGIENYSRHLDQRKPGERPYTIMDYLVLNAKERNESPLLIIDESHMMIPQLNAMYNGDRSRKINLVDYGFRLPSALDNRPLKFKEFEKFDFQTVFISATPAQYELNKTNGEIVSQIVRPTGLVDPTVEVQKTMSQVEDIYDRIQKQIQTKERTIILTTTKRMAEELSNYLREKRVKSAYIHSDYKTFERDEILRKLRLGVYDVVIGINLIREGIDLPEVSLILVLDADKESFFRSTTSLIQIIGRAARNANGHVVLYGDRLTKSMQAAIDETNRRRKIQVAHNKLNNIVPQTIIKAIPEPLNPEKTSALNKLIESRNNPRANFDLKKNASIIKKEIAKYRGKMLYSSKQMDFERAAQYRDLIIELEAMLSE